MRAIAQTKTWLLVAALACLLLLLAGLQYRWLTQVSAADHERRQAALKTAAQRFSEDFDRELARAFISFQLDSHTLARQAEAEFARRYDRWQAQAPFPPLIMQVCLVTSGKEAAAQCYEPVTRRILEQMVTPTLAELRGKLTAQRPDHLVGHDVPLPPGLVRLDTGIPALVSPVITVETFPPIAPSQSVAPGQFKFEHFSPRLDPPELFSRYTVVLLNEQYLRDEMIPTLAQRYFADAATPGLLEYQLLITDREPGRQVVFKSDPAAPPNAQRADMESNLFSLRFDLIDNFTLGASVFTAPAPALPARGVALRVEGSMSGGHVGVGGIAVGSGGSAAVAPPDRLTLFNHEASFWRLALWHRSGSLEKAVADVRSRNLFISFGILLSLSSSMALVLVLTTRARRLAAQQLEFIAGISHELRTPVSVVCMASANLADGMVRGDEQVQQYGAMLQTEGRRLSEMIEQVLDLAGTEAVRQPYQLQPVPVTEPLERALATLRQHTNEADINIECEIALGLPALLADSRALERTLYNLLNNAVKYSHKPCWVRVRAQQASAARLVIEVADCGFGIDPAEIPHLFEPFWRGRVARASNLPGNGLGLCLVNRIVRAHSGKITVTSQPGVGSTFALYLPCVQVEAS
jgi:signal transduction histidine kinase